jgi:hypothetical protein
MFQTDSCITNPHSIVLLFMSIDTHYETAVNQKDLFIAKMADMALWQ